MCYYIIYVAAGKFEMCSGSKLFAGGPFQNGCPLSPVNFHFRPMTVLVDRTESIAGTPTHDIQWLCKQNDWVLRHSACEKDNCEARSGG